MLISSRLATKMRMQTSSCSQCPQTMFALEGFLFVPKQCLRITLDIGPPVTAKLCYRACLSTHHVCLSIATGHALLCFALLCSRAVTAATAASFALLCFALLCFALLGFPLLCFLFVPKQCLRIILDIGPPVTAKLCYRACLVMCHVCLSVAAEHALLCFALFCFVPGLPQLPQLQALLPAEICNKTLFGARAQVS
jgi:hypothetical protein